MNEEQRVFCEELASDFASVRSLLVEHIGYYGEFLSHVFLGELTRYLLREGNERTAIVQRLEEAFHNKSEDIQNLICASFVENIETRDELDRLITGIAGLKIREEWRKHHLL